MTQYEQIVLEDYFQSGEGGQALTYTRKDGSAMAKLFLKSIGVETVEREFRISQAVYATGIPCPKPIRLVTDGERFGAEYEVIANKRSFTRIISQEPEQLEPLTVKFASLGRQLHAKPANTEVFPDMKELVRPWMEKSECISEPLRARLLEALDSIPSVKTCLHGDFHIGNIITNGEKDYWIDLGDFAYGAPEWDLSMNLYMAYYMPAQYMDSFFHLDCETFRKHWNLLIKSYYGFRTLEEQRACEKEILKYSALKLFFNFCKRYNGKGEPNPRLEGVAQAFLSGKAPGVFE
ncbi:MAG: TIGR02172 family protein [Bacteroidales bacterium]|nr:TIGR02172 family protein [Bacteroidales bacterium]